MAEKGNPELAQEAARMIDEIVAREKCSRSAAFRRLGISGLAPGKIMNGESCTQGMFERVQTEHDRVFGVSPKAARAGMLAAPRDDDEEPEEPEESEDADELPEHIAEWIATKQLASIDNDTQRGIIELHNRGLLVYPPRVLDYGETAFCVAFAHSFTRMVKLITECVPGAKPVAMDELALPSGIAGTKLADHGIWVLIETTPPTHKEVLAYVRELNAEARDAA